MWEDSPNKNDNIMFRRMKSIGAGQVKIGDKRLWTNSEVILDRLIEEKERRKWRKERSVGRMASEVWQRKRQWKQRRKRRRLGEPAKNCEQR